MKEFLSQYKDKKLYIISSVDEMIDYRNSLDKALKIGFVPTMGYLHQGHLSLVEKAKEENDIVIVSIFVNPSQFGQGEDFENYPRDLERDLNLLLTKDVDIVFNPNYKDVYPDNYKTWIEVSDFSDKYCGASRPGHFKGVATIVNKLVNIIKPDFMYMGEKDFQQIVVLQTMLRDLNISTKITPCPIIRESDGLAMSSRNVYLTQQERENATCLYHSLIIAKDMLNKKTTDINLVKSEMEKIISNSSGKIDYIAFIDNDSFNPVSSLTHNTRILLAIKIGKTRLIDNMKMS